MPPDTLDYPKELDHVLAPNEEIHWTGAANPRFPLLICLAHAAYLAFMVAVCQMGWLEVLGFMLVGWFALLIGNISLLVVYCRSNGAFYVCTDRRYLTLHRRWFGKTELISLPRKFVEYISIDKRSLILYNEHGYTKDEETDRRRVHPRGFLELDNAQEAISIIEAAGHRDAGEPQPEPVLIHIGDLPLSIRQREMLERLLEKGEKLYFAAAPSRRFGLPQLFGGAGAGVLGWLVCLCLHHAVSQISHGLWSLAISYFAGVLVLGLLLLVVAIPLKEWRRRCKTYFILTDRRACEISLVDGSLLETWAADPDLIKEGSLYSDGHGDFTFSLDHCQTTRADASNKESGVRALPDASKLIAIINALPHR